MADEQVIGVAQLRLEADVDDLVRGLKETADRVDKTGAAFARLTEKGEKEGASLLNAQRRIQNEIAALTESATMRQIRAVDERTAREIRKAEERGVAVEDINRLEVASYQRKHAILVADEKRAAAERAAAMGTTTKAAEALGDEVRKGETKAAHFKNALGMAGVETGRLGAAISLLNSGLTPLTFGLGAAAGLLMTYTGKMKAAQAANEQFLRGAAEGRLRLKEQEIDLAAKAGAIVDAEIAKLRLRAEAQTRVVEEAARKAEEIEKRALVGFGRYVAGDAGNADKANSLGRALGSMITSGADEAIRKWNEEAEKLVVILGEIALAEGRVAAATDVATASTVAGAAATAVVADMYTKTAEMREQEFQFNKRLKKDLAEAAAFEKEIDAAVKEEIKSQERSVEVAEERVRAAEELNYELSRTVNIQHDITDSDYLGWAKEAYDAGETIGVIEARLRMAGIDPDAIGFNAGATGPAPYMVEQPWTPESAFAEAAYRATMVGAAANPFLAGPALNVRIINNYANLVGVTATPSGDGVLLEIVAADLLNAGPTARALEERYPDLRAGGG